MLTLSFHKCCNKSGPVISSWDEWKTTGNCTLHCATGAQDLFVLGDRDRKRKAPLDVNQSEAALTSHNVKLAFYPLKSNGERGPKMAQKTFMFCLIVVCIKA